MILFPFLIEKNVYLPPSHPLLCTSSSLLRAVCNKAPSPVAGQIADFISEEVE